MDWGDGRYEDTAAALEPAAQHVVELARLAPGERVLDIGCGTGNAALLAGRTGAVVTGIDPASRLVEVARERSAAGQADATFVVGDARALPFDDASFDVALSVFAVIFAGDPDRVVAEIARVVRPGGRALISAWVPEGTIDRCVGVVGRAVASVTGADRPPFPWHHRSAVAELAHRHRATVDAYDGEIEFTAESPEAYYAAQEQNHPMSLAACPILQSAGVYDEVRRESIAILGEGNRDPKAFRVTAPYRVLELRLDPSERP